MDEAQNQFGIVSHFEWNEERNKAAVMLATGYTNKEAAEAAGVTDRTIYNWKKDPEFEMVVDQLAVMHGVASAAYRFKLLNKMVRKKLDEEGNPKGDDGLTLLELLKEARLQKEGISLGILEQYKALADEARSVARSGQVRDGGLPESDSEGAE